MRVSAHHLRPAPIRAGRWVLALLAVLASLAHLTRSPGAGGLGLTLGTLTQTVAGGHEAPTEAAAHVHVAGVPCDPPSPRTAEAGAAHAGGHALTDAAPNAPPHHAHGDTHCPFCLTAGFALAAADGPRVGPRAQRALHVTTRTAGPVTFALRHADARAPPLA
ncbi:hypothetical protein [Deinococcus sp. RM]|uniref:hypothetical protein n=1 Tax=Deinococcus sp. RM TaxID=2316359 RepID=UPI003AB6BA78